MLGLLCGCRTKKYLRIFLIWIFSHAEKQHLPRTPPPPPFGMQTIIIIIMIIINTLYSPPSPVAPGILIALVRWVSSCTLPKMLVKPVLLEALHYIKTARAHVKMPPFNCDRIGVISSSLEKLNLYFFCLPSQFWCSALPVSGAQEETELSQGFESREITAKSYELK